MCKSNFFGILALEKLVFTISKAHFAALKRGGLWGKSEPNIFTEVKDKHI